MKTLLKLIGLVGIVATAILVDRRRRKPLLEPVLRTPHDIVDAEIILGIAEIDPEPLTQVAGEGIDPDATREAHEGPREQRAKMPVRGKNVP
jgi:hypothetical protein